MTKVSGLEQHKPSIVEVQTMIRLKYSEDELFGRYKEQQILLNTFGEVANDKSQIVFIEGEGGVGKTRLVNSMKALVGEKRFASGEFEEIEITVAPPKPFSGVLVALRNLCAMIRPRHDAPKIGEAIMTEMNDDLAVLLQLVPALESILPRGAKSDMEAISASSFDRFPYVLQDFLRIVCSHLGPVLLFVDNLNNGDKYTFQLIKMLQTSSSQLRGLLLVGAYRPQSRESTFTLFVNHMKRQLGVKRIVLSPSSHKSVNTMLAKAMEVHPDKTEELTKIVMSKTNGNMLGVRTFLQIAQDAGMVIYCPKKFAWQWNLEDLKAKTAISDNLVHVILVRMQQLPPLDQTALSIAATLGASFDVDIIAEILANMGSRSQAHLESSRCLRVWNALSQCDVRHLFQALRNLGFIDQGPDGWSKFAHSQQAALELIEEGRDKLHLAIGKALLSSRQRYVNTNRAEWVFHACVDQLNLGSSLLAPFDRLDLAQMNLEAAQKAKKHSAFIPAAEYADNGTKLVKGVDCWTNHYGLVLSLATMAAEMHQVLGNWTRCLNRLQDILTNAKSMNDRLDAYYIRLEVLGSIGRLGESVKEGCQLLTMLGISHLSENLSLVHIARQFQKTRALLKGFKEEELLSLPEMTDETQVATMRIITKTKSNAYFANDRRILAILYCKCLQFTLQNGMCEYTPSAFVDYGSLCTGFFQNIEEGYRLGTIGMAIMEKLPKDKNRRIMAKVHADFYFHLSHWREPLHSCLEPLLRGHRYGMKGGDISNGLVCFGAYCMAYMESGLDLIHVANDMEKAITLMLEYKQETVANVFRPLWQLTMCLMGEEDDPLTLTGKAMDQDELMKRNISDSNLIGARMILACRMQLGHLLQDHSLTKKCLNAIQKYKADVQPHFGHCYEPFIEGLTCFALARTSKKGAIHMRQGRLCKKKIQRWTKSRAVNCLHLLLILEAEEATFQKRLPPEEIREKFDRAISASARSGFRQNEALASERAAVYFREIAQRSQQFDPFYQPKDWADSYMCRSYERYLEWGAKAKMDAMELTYPHLVGARLLGSTESTLSGSSFGSGQLRARSRFNQRMTEKHKAIEFF